MADDELQTNCKYCKKPVSNWLKCEVCNGIYHPSCATRVLGLVVTSKTHVICCEQLKDQKQEKSSEERILSFLKGTQFAVIIKNVIEEEISKQTIELKEIINNLKEEIINLKSCNLELVKLVSNEHTVQTEILNIKEIGTEEVDKEGRKKQLYSEKLTMNGRCSIVTPTERQNQEANKLFRKQEKLAARIINLEKDREQEPNGNIKNVDLKRQKPTEDDGNWKRGKNKTNQNTIVGSGKDIKTISAAQRKAWLFVGRLDPEVKAENMYEHIKDIVAHENFSVEKLETKTKSACFKLSINFNEKDKLIDPTKWPEGVQIRRFFFRSDTDIPMKT